MQRVKKWAPKKPVVEVGDRFRECDKRFTRIVEVVSIKGDKAEIKNLSPCYSGKISSRTTWARLDRFFKYSNGYQFLGGRCHECQIKAGAVVPRGGHRGITVQLGTCGGCLKADATLVPSCDYHWPKEGRKAVFD